MATRYYISIPEGAAARGDDPDLSFKSSGPEGLAEELQNALRTDALFEKWRGKQDEPDDVDPTLAATDPSATVVGEQDSLKADLIVTTSISGNVLKHRLRLLAGSHWELRDVTAA